MNPAGVPGEVTFSEKGWKIVGPEKFAYRHWGEEFVVYCGVNATTHVVTELSGLILAALASARGTMREDEVAWLVFGDVATQGEADTAHSALHDTLLELERSGLVARSTH